jgi:hypothetical protein
MTLDELLVQVRDRRLLLLQHGAIWSPNQYVPAVTRRAIREHKAELMRLIAESDIRTCASPSWHCSYWKHAGNGCYRCQVCENIVFT